MRRKLYPAEGAPRFAQQMLWRAAVVAEPFLDGLTMVIAGHFRQRIVVYPIGTARGGKVLINWICQKTVPDARRRARTGTGGLPRKDVLAAFGSWRFPWLDLPSLIEALTRHLRVSVGRSRSGLRVVIRPRHAAW